MFERASSPLLQLIRRVCKDPQLKDSPDPELLRRFLGERDETAFAALVRRHGPMVLDVCRGVLGNEADAEDAFQATFLILARQAESIRKAGSLASWLHGVAHRTALRARADSARRQRHEARAPQRSTPTDPDEVTWREVRQAVHEELAQLPERQRAALVLCYLQGKTQDEAAAQLGLAKGTLKGHLERGRELLRARLVRRGLGPGAVLVLGAWPVATAVAGVSFRLPVATVKAAAALAAGGGAASVVSPKVATLTQGMMKAMGFQKLKIAAILLLAIAGTGLGLALATRGLPHADADADGVAEQPAPPEKPKLRADAGTRPGADLSMPIRSLASHTNRVTSVAYSSDGTWIATASWDSTARIWDARTGKEVLRVDSPYTTDCNSVDQIAFSPDNTFIVTVMRESTDKWAVIVWNRRTGEKVRTFPAEGARFAISPDGRWIACGGYRVIRLYDLATGKLVRDMHDVDEKQLRITSLTFSPDGKTLVSAGQSGQSPTPQRDDGVTRLTIMPDVIRVWDVATGKARPSAVNGLEVGRLGHPHIARSTDGRTLVHARRHDISLREIATGGERVKLIGHKFDLWDFAFSPDGRTLASGSLDGTVRLWDLLSGKELGCFATNVDPPQVGWVLSVAFSPDGRMLVSGGMDKKAHIWDVSWITRRQRAGAERSPADLEADWKDLAGDTAAGYAALGQLVSAQGRAVAFLGKQLQSAAPVDSRRIERLIENLDDEQFSVREQATKELEALADRAAPALRQALASGPSAEARRRLRALLDRLDAGRLSAETVREIRAVEALEAIGTPEARRVLDQLAARPAETRLTQEARAAAGRLAKRLVVTP